MPIDVEILHNIVVLAQTTLPTLPERERLPTNALFNAYYDILPRIGVNADYDSRYARVLFKIGGLRSQGTLYEKFEEILSRMGIDIELDRDEDYDTSSYLEDSQSKLAPASGQVTAAQEDAQGLPPERWRRNSESTKWDLGTGTQARTPTRRSSFSAASKFNGNTDGLPRFLRDLAQPQPDQTKDTKEPDQDEANPIGNARPRMNRLAERPQWERGRSLSTHGSIRIRRQSTSVAPSHGIQQHGSFPGSEYPQGTISEATAITSYGEENNGRRSKNSYNGFVFTQPSPSLMEIKASLILQHHISFLAKQHIALWRERALQLQEDSRGLQLIALNHDKKVLLRGALIDWRSRLRAKRMSLETEGFFVHLEARATRARELYLMHIAFTHWSACATEQVQRTALARRHIIRTKVFNAWREITAVNELKVRRQVLKKFFGVWKKVNTARADRNQSAIQRHRGNLAERIYMLWVEKHRTIKATKWLNEGIKRRALFRWIVESHNSWEERRTAEEKRRLRLIRNTWSIWRARTVEHIQQRQAAESYYLSQCCRKSFRRWYQEALLVSVEKGVQTNVNIRILRESLETWLHRCRQEKQASNFDRLKILREAWTNWQYKSRIKIVTARADSRVASQAIYKWVIAARALGLKQRVEGRVKREIFDIWSSQSRVAHERRLYLEDEARSFVLRKEQSSVLETWRSKLKHRNQLEQTASNLSESRILRVEIGHWQLQTGHLQQLQRWAGDANFYFLASKTLKKWKSSAETAKREKRKTAYTQVRRIKKLNLAGGIFRNWQCQTREVLRLNNQAHQVSHNKTIVLGTNVFDRWFRRAQEVSELNAFYREMTLRKYYDIWRMRVSALQELETEALITYQEHRQSRAVKNWNLKALKLRAQSNYAREIHEKNAKRTFRKILQYWHQKAAQKRPFTRPDPALLGAPVRAEAWSDAGDDLEINDWGKEVDEAPVPGYLSTPSKRSERAKSIATRFSTTPRMPLSTPLERQFRTQYSGGGLPSFRKTLGRSTLGLGRGFADIQEKDMTDIP